MSRISIPAAKRIIIAADFDVPKGESNPEVYLYDKIMNLAVSIADTGIMIKVNTGLRTIGYKLIRTLHEHGLYVFADLKLVDIPETLSKEGKALAPFRPDMLTVAETAGVWGMRALKEQLPETHVLGVQIFTSLKEEDSQSMYGRTLDAAMQNFSGMAMEAGLDGLICSPAEAPILRREFPNALIVTPGIRPEWSVVKGDDQNLNRVMTPAKALEADADYLVIGRPITTANNPKDAIMRTIEEVERALAA